MPTKVKDLFNHFGLPIHGQVNWGELINSSERGFYVVALTPEKDKLVCMSKPTFDLNVIQKWIDLIESGGKQILIDDNVANIQTLTQRLERFWLPDETILYIGKAGPSKKRTLRQRVKEYYQTVLGCDKKHAGGNWINCLSNIKSLTVYYSEYSGQDIEEKEEQLIDYFMRNVSEQTKRQLLDPINSFPFANKEINRKSVRQKIRKAHGISNQTVTC
jgi:hypothetical protein